MKQISGCLFTRILLTQFSIRNVENISLTLDERSGEGNVNTTSHHSLTRVTNNRCIVLQLSPVKVDICYSDQETIYSKIKTPRLARK
jgi:hypothetical protein